MNILLVMVGGFIGSIARFYISSRFASLLGTWIANVTGSFILGLLLRYYMETALAEWMWFLCGVGFCGAYTTFSTFGNETVQLIHEGKTWRALGYVGASVGVSLLVVFVVLSI
ncbi:fluoride efflux transporter FluC [Virgibacillus kekensis]|uniref:Fluoride-specific ion channel FluC n=1 Tax=Virgibacillus kekensis TaxID=202261 RepID=A0ABV9DIQ3_9BACI